MQRDDGQIGSELDKIREDIDRTITFGGFMKEVSSSILLALSLSMDPSQLVEDLTEQRRKNIDQITKLSE